MCIRVYRIMGRKSRIVPQLGIEILKKKNFDTVNHYFSPYTFSVCHLTEVAQIIKKLWNVVHSFANIMALGSKI